MLSIIENLKTPIDIQLELAGRAKSLRLALNISQQDLADRSGVSLGSLRRFEQTGEISLGNLVLLAIALNRAGDLSGLFASEALPDLFAPKPKKRQRSRS